MKLILDYEDFKVTKDSKGTYFLKNKEDVFEKELEVVAKFEYDLNTSEDYLEVDLLTGVIKLDSVRTITVNGFDITGEQVEDDKINYWYFKNKTGSKSHKETISFLTSLGDGDSVMLNPEFLGSLFLLRRKPLKTEKAKFYNGIDYLLNYWSDDDFITVTVDTLEAIDEILYSLYVNEWHRLRDNKPYHSESPASFEEFVSNERELEFEEQLTLYCED